jgi:hypothetical protein
MPGRHAARVLAAAGSLEHHFTAPARHSRPLDTFFPFDPYLLRRSAGALELRRTYIRWQSSEALDDALDYDSDGRSTASGLDGHPGSAADDSFREHYGMAMQHGLARPAPLGGTAGGMSLDEAVFLNSDSLGAMSLH